MDELSEEDKLKVARARKIERFLSQPFQSLKFSPAILANLSPSPRPSLDSRRSWLASTITCPRLLSTWSAMLTRLLPRQTVWQLKEENRLCSIYRSRPSWPETSDSHIIWC